MRPFGTNEQLAARRKYALTLLRRDWNAGEVAETVGVTVRSVRRWWQAATTSKRKKPSRPPGRPSRLSAQQLRRLENALKRGAYAQGYAEDYWTLDRIAHLIWELFGVRYHPSAVWHKLRRLDWSCQQPQRQSLSRDDQAIARWKRYVWPQIKKVA
jgi:transposase